ncbi:hypothetical protein [Microbacterium sp. GXF6406]
MSSPIPSPNISNTVIAAIRTFVPIAVGALVTWLATANIALDPSSEVAIASGLTALVTAVYWAAATWLARKFPWAGWLLGYPAQPEYAHKPHEVIAPVAEAPAEGVLYDDHYFPEENDEPHIFRGGE